MTINPHSYTAKIEEALWLLHSYESNREDFCRTYSETEIAEMVAALRGSHGPKTPPQRYDWTEDGMEKADGYGDYVKWEDVASLFATGMPSKEQA